jgi:hypothetical protein
MKPGKQQLAIRQASWELNGNSHQQHLLTGFMPLRTRFLLPLCGLPSLCALTHLPPVLQLTFSLCPDLFSPSAPDLFSLSPPQSYSLSPHPQPILSLPAPTHFLLPCHNSPSLHYANLSPPLLSGFSLPSLSWFTPPRRQLISPPSLSQFIPPRHHLSWEGHSGSDFSSYVISYLAIIHSQY